MKFLCRLGLHSGHVVRDTVCHRYRVCRWCGKREITGGCVGGYQPIDRGWLETGAWTRMRVPTRSTKGDAMTDDARAVPHHAYAFANGMLMVFDVNGQQVPEYQGPTAEYLPRLRDDFPSCRIEGARWDGRRENPIVRIGG